MKNLYIILCLFFLSACSLDYGASQAEYDFVSYTKIVCDDANFQKAQYDRFYSNSPEKFRLSIESRIQKTNEKCEVLENIKDSSLATYEKLKEGIYFPKQAHLFQIKIKVKNKSNFRVVGFFNSENTCEAQRENLEKIGYETIPCYSRILFWKVAWA